MADSQVCRWVSTKPGITMNPVASMTSASALISGWTAAIRSSSMSTSPVFRSPTCGSIDSTMPPRMSFRLLMARPFDVEPGRLIGGESTHRVDHLVDSRDDLVLKRVGERQRDAFGGHPPHRRVQQFKSFIGHNGGHGASPPALLR